MNYEESIDYLQGLTKFGVNLGLGRIRYLLTQLGSPERKVEYIHIGGTNGKGSTATMLATILQQSGMKVGLFTSPHLNSYLERIKINGREIPKEEIGEILTLMKTYLDAMADEGMEHPTEFEVITALAFYYFAREKVDLAVVEVGLGGEIDSTNVILPRISIITNVALDHMDYLGPTVEDIARVKSGIIKAGKDVITAVDHPEAQRIIREQAREKGCSLWEYGEDFWVDPVSFSQEGTIFHCTVKNTLFPNLKISLLGQHQIINASLAVAAAVKLGAGSLAIRKGLETSVWPCRLEIVRENPLMVIDAAHNHQGMKVLVDSLEKYWPKKKKVLLLGILEDKEREKMVKEIVPLVEKAVITKPDSPRTGAWQKVVEFIRPYVKEVIVEENVCRAVDEAVQLAGNEYMVLITGSIYMVAEARAYILSNYFVN